MADGTVYLGSRRYSSWSLRGWLAVKLAGLDVDEQVMRVDGSGATPAIKRASPSGLVPYLVHRGHHVWDSLAIIEYCAEIFPPLWPADFGARTHARVISAEMHGGFRALRQAMPMNLLADKPGFGRTEGALADIARIDTIWQTTRERFGGGGPFLMGESFSGADAMYAPVVARFLSYRPALSDVSAVYCAAVREHGLVAEWYSGAAAEPAEWAVPSYEVNA
jgi:glutathione S-transferase